MRSLIMLALAVLIAGCGEEKVSFISPCGVLSDSLRDVQGKTPADARRIDVHFERGVAAGCWKRTGH